MFMRTVGLALSLMIALPVAAPARPQNLTHLKGHWEGHAIKDERTFALFVDFDQLADPKVAYVAYVDLNLHGVPFVPSVCGSSICVERRPQNGPVSTFKGKIASGRFTGYFNGAGAKDARFELRRVSAASRILREERVTFRNGPVALEARSSCPTVGVRSRRPSSRMAATPNIAAVRGIGARARSWPGTESPL